MYNADLENQLILIDIRDAMVDYVSIQPDIDESKIKSAAIVAQKLDIQRLIGAANVARCVDPDEGSEDEKLKDLIIPPLCYFTYARLLKMFQGSFTDAGFTLEVEAEDRGPSKSQANEMSSIAETFMEEVFEFLEKENPNDEEVDKEKLYPRIRVFGGKEQRASN